MGSSHSDLREHEVQHLSETTGFSSEQIRNLHKRFKNLTHNSDTLSRGDLEKIGDLTFNPIRSQIIDAFFDKRNFRQDEVGTVEEIGFEEFLTVMSHFRPLNQELTQEDKDKIRKEKLHFLFNMHDKDNDGIITLDEYRQCTRSGNTPQRIRQRSRQVVLMKYFVCAFRSFLHLCVDVLQLVEELLSNSAIEGETSKSIADAAMLEVASVTMGQMAPDEVYEGITFEHFLQILKGVEIESRMYIRFLYVDTTTMRCGK
ncbi:tescalcin a isoform X1 [Ictalurus punctatus]|uniref:Calcineurin B homologous protein 3 n=1 Tax=Ictalurus punctatus TaxID=7998 RepID=A0A979EFF1_ICTPU|nr:tescalcin a isoform X1 [Ictalurus punctatus]